AKEFIDRRQIHALDPFHYRDQLNKGIEAYINVFELLEHMLLVGDVTKRVQLVGETAQVLRIDDRYPRLSDQHRQRGAYRAQIVLQLKDRYHPLCVAEGPEYPETAIEIRRYFFGFDNRVLQGIEPGVR